MMKQIVYNLELNTGNPENPKLFGLKLFLGKGHRAFTKQLNAMKILIKLTVCLMTIGHIDLGRSFFFCI